MNYYIPEDLEQMIKEIVSIEELEKLARENEEEFERSRVYIEELEKADKIDSELWRREITI